MAANIKTKGFQPAANPEMHRAMVGKRTSSAAGSHSSLPNRERSRSARKGAAISRALRGE
jgi:hypothetical protein